MKMLSRIASNVGFAAMFLLGFLLLFEGKIEIPFWLQPFGRMHPLLLHLPIGILSLVILLPLLKQEIAASDLQKVRTFMIDLSLLLSIMTTLMGLFLAQEEGYLAGSINTHKWLAIGLCLAIYGLHLLLHHWPQQKTVFNISLGVTFLLVVLTGHFGGEITHGEDFVLSPIRAKEQPPTDQMSLFAAAIHPVLKNKCLNCHNEKKAKGELIMTTKEGLLKGGKSGPLWQMEEVDSSLILQRLHLPMTEKKHMPPDGKPQLTEVELAMLTAWIKEGADLEQRKEAFEPESDFYQLAEQYLATKVKSKERKDKYNFRPASASVLKRLNGPLRSVYPEALNSPALNAKISIRKYYQPALLEELLAVKDQLVYLNLTDLPIKDEEITTIARFSRLEKLILNGTDISGHTLDQLKNCDQLRILAVSSTAIDHQIQSALEQLTNLRELFIWNTQIDSTIVRDWAEKFPNINIYQGYMPDTSEVLKLSPPMLENEKLIIAANEKVSFKHPLSGTVIRYTTDGSDPDSLNAPIYKEPIPVSEITTFKVRAFLAGWEGSETEIFTIFKQGIQPKNVELINPADKNYLGIGPQTLIDGEKGVANTFRSPFWLGYRKTSLEAVFNIGDNVQVSRMVFSYAVNLGSYIMPPEKVELWGGNEGQEMKKLGEIKPDQAKKETPTKVEAIVLDFPPSQYSLYKVIAHPLKKLPNWHEGKKKKGWVFSDEVLFFGPN